MRLTGATRYGLLAVAYIAQNQDKGIIISKDVSKNYNIPWENLQQILGRLVRARILQGKRGPRGGFSLARPAAKITMLEIIEAIEGSFDVSLGFEECAAREKFAAKAERLYTKAFAQSRQALKKVKLSDLI